MESFEQDAHAPGGGHSFQADYLAKVDRSIGHLHFEGAHQSKVIIVDADIPGESSGQVTVGANFRPTRDTALKFDYVRGRGRDRFNNLAQQLRGTTAYNDALAALLEIVAAENDRVSRDRIVHIADGETARRQ